MSKMMEKNEKSLDLEDIYYKYERLTSLISIMQMFVAEIVEITGTPSNSLTNALYEVELEMKKNNERLKSVIQQKEGATL